MFDIQIGRDKQDTWDSFSKKEESSLRESYKCGQATSKWEFSLKSLKVGKAPTYF